MGAESNTNDDYFWPHYKVPVWYDRFVGFSLFYLHIYWFMILLVYGNLYYMIIEDV